MGTEGPCMMYGGKIWLTPVNMLQGKSGKHILVFENVMHLGLSLFGSWTPHHGQKGAALSLLRIWGGRSLEMSDWGPFVIAPAVILCLWSLTLVGYMVILDYLFNCSFVTEDWLFPEYFLSCWYLNVISFYSCPQKSILCLWLRKAWKIEIPCP